MTDQTEQQHEPTTAALVPVAAAAGITRPAATLGQITSAFSEYQQVRNALLEPSDFQQIGSGQNAKSHPKKSAWRKLAVAFNVTCELVSRDYERDIDGQIIRAEIVVRAIAPGGRFMEGLGSCDLREKCCRASTCRNTKNWHTHCDQEAGHDPGVHFSHPQHDIPATAMTRATNRACSDLFGFGEVSAEEIQSAPDAPQWQLLDWPNDDALREWLDAFRTWARAQDRALGAAFDAWRNENEISHPPRYDQHETVDQWTYEHGRTDPNAPAWSEADERPFAGPGSSDDDDVADAEIVDGPTG